MLKKGKSFPSMLFFRDTSWNYSSTGKNHLTYLFSFLHRCDNGRVIQKHIEKECGIFRCKYFARYFSCSQSILSFWEPEILVVQKRSVYIRTYARAYNWNMGKYIFFSWKHFIIKSGWLINLSRYIGVFACLKGTSRPWPVTSLWWCCCFQLTTNCCIFLRIYLLKMSWGKRRKSFMSP